MSQEGRGSGGDIYDMAAKGTTVPESAAEPRHIKSVPRPGEGADSGDPNQLGGASLADAATNATDIPRSNQDTAGDAQILSGTGDALPSQVDSKRLHAVPGGVTHDDNAKGSTRYTKHIAQDSEFDTAASDGAQAEAAPGQEKMSQEEITDSVEKKL